MRRAEYTEELKEKQMKNKARMAPRALYWMLELAILPISVGILALAQSSPLPGPGTAIAPESERVVRMPLLMPDDFSVLHLVAWRVESGIPDADNPLLEGDMPWDSGGVGIHGSVFQDPLSRKWRAYLVCTPPDETSTDWPQPWSSRNDRKRRLCVFTSEDGVHWIRPELHEVAVGDRKSTNVLLRLDQGTAAYSSIMVDPTNREYPYLMYVLREKSDEGVPPAGKNGFYLYRSRDGYHWELLPASITGPISGDSGFIYKFGPNEYVAYYRLGQPRQPGDYVPVYEDGARRTIMRATSSDGINWMQDKSMLLTNDALDHTDTQYQELAPLRVNGGYLAMVTIYHPISQTQDLRVAASRDGSNWWFPDRRPALGNAPLGDYGGGMIWSSQNLIVQNGRLYFYYGGMEGTHRELADSLAPSISVGYLEHVIDHGAHFLPFNAALCRASWQYDRMYALISSAGGPTVGIAVTNTRVLANKQLWVNIVTRPAKKSPIPGFDEGYLQVELLDSMDRPIVGFSRDDCAPLKGDHHAVQVKWRGGMRAPKEATKARFYIKRTLLYGFDFRE
jgi:hypothetical protein